MIRKLLSSFLFVCLLTISGMAQDQAWEGGLMLGTASMGGDLIDNNLVLLDQASFGYGLMLRRRLGQHFGLRLDYHGGTLKADDSKSDNELQRMRNYSATTSMNDFSLNLEFDILGHRRFREGKFYRILSPYVFAGFGMAFFDPQAEFNGSTRPGAIADQMADIKTTELIYPFGGGLRLDLSPNWAIAVEAAPRAISTDYLDGVSQAGNALKDDTYIFTGLQIWHRFGKLDKDGDGIADKVDACPDEPGPEATMGCPDGDGDGVADKDDACPDEAGELAFQGCPDTDGDGIPDKDDACPNEGGTEATNGCPDRDGDGIADADDDCPDAAGTAALNGCPDTDGDGIADNEDNCPTTKGVASANGCPDADGDGVADAEDDCPDKAGTSATNGCPDADGDGIADKDDKCPDVAGVATADGCPENRFDADFLTAAGIQNLLFDTDKDDLRNRSDDILDKLAALMEANPELAIVIEGHADHRESDAYNMRLSQERADSALDYLVRKGIARERLTTNAYGESQPVASNATAAGMQQNRRVEFKVRD